MKPRRLKLILFILALVLLLLSNAGHAHKPSDSYLTLTMRDAGLVDVNWHIALRDLDTELNLDRDDDGRLSWGEVRPRWPELLNFSRPTLVLRHGTDDCAPTAPPNALPPQIDTHTDGRYVVLRWTAQCPLLPGQAWDRVSADYRLFALTDPTHRGIVRWRTPSGEAGTVVLGTPRPSHDLRFSGVQGLLPSANASTASSTAPRAPSPRSTEPPESFWSGLGRYIQDGMHHIAIGTDHILFLVCLLLVSVWQRQGHPPWWPPMAGWRARTPWHGSLREVLKLVTAFTLAHSMTLGLAAFGVLSPPSRWVESLIALSVLLAALDNLLPLLRGPRWVVVFGFGLVHGFGFAGALQDLGLAKQDLAAPLLGFNLGVELGQLALVSIALPVMALLRKTGVYRWLVVGGGSLFIAAIALVWLIERVFDVLILGWGQ
ncbi:MAG: HupE/UreJ family protein [Rubrivivax sp.]|nr:MAG: HupE/UreJ family protein [Rubrivivax sp.]